MGITASAKGIPPRRQISSRVAACFIVHVDGKHQELADRYARRFFPKDFETWRLNESQRKVITTILTRKLTLVQGPPGTGMSHLE